MPPRFSILQLGRVLFAPTTVFSEMAVQNLSAPAVFFGARCGLDCFRRCSPIGTMLFGWRLGVEPLFLPRIRDRLAIASAYFALLLVGFLSTAFVVALDGVAPTAPTSSWSRSFSLVTLVGAPLTVGSVVHLYPNAFMNVLVLVPTLIWSMYLSIAACPRAEDGPRPRDADGIFVDRLPAGRVGDAARNHRGALEPRHRPARRDVITMSNVRGSMTAAPDARAREAIRRPHRHGIHCLLDRLGDPRHGGRRLRRRRARLAGAQLRATVAVLRPTADRRTRISCCSASACRR